MKDMCAECGADLRKDDTVTTASVPMVHAIPELKVSEEVSFFKNQKSNKTNRGFDVGSPKIGQSRW